MRLVSDPSFALRLECVDDACTHLVVERWNGAPTDQAGPLRRDLLGDFLKTRDWRKVYAFGRSSITYDPAAGGLNLFLPLFKMMGWTVALSHDAVEQLSDAKKHLRTVLRTISHALGEVDPAGQDRILKISREDFVRLDETFAEIQRCGDKFI